MSMTIEPEIQEAILDILPGNGQKALLVIAQLAANMVLSIDGATIENFMLSVENYYRDYERDET